MAPTRAYTHGLEASKFIYLPDLVTCRKWDTWPYYVPRELLEVIIANTRSLLFQKKSSLQNLKQRPRSAASSMPLLDLRGLPNFTAIYNSSTIINSQKVRSYFCHNFEGCRDLACFPYELCFMSMQIWKMESIFELRGQKRSMYLKGETPLRFDLKFYQTIL